MFEFIFETPVWCPMCHGLVMEKALKEILKPCPSEWLNAVEVSPLVNSSKNNSPELLQPHSEAAVGNHAPRLFELQDFKVGVVGQTAWLATSAAHLREADYVF